MAQSRNRERGYGRKRGSERVSTSTRGAKSRRRKRVPEKKKVTRFRRHRLNNLNIGLFIFLAMMAYIITILVGYFQTAHVAGYEVQMGSLAINTTARAVALREERVYSSKAHGYINYYAREGERVNSGALVYSIDESGKLNDIISTGRNLETSFTDSQLEGLRIEAENYAKNFEPHRFSTVYDFKYTVEGEIQSLVNLSTLGILEGLSANTAGSSIAMGYSDYSGVVVYSTDGLEDLTPAAVNASTFVEADHPRISHANQALVSVSDNAFKLLTDEEWSLMMPWDEAWNEEFEDGEYIEIHFLKNGYTAWGKMSRIMNSDGDYMKLDFTNSMVSFATERYLDVELVTNEKQGLKLPNTSIVEREFFLVPEQFMTKGGDSDTDGFYRQYYTEKGGKGVEFVEAKAYDNQDGNLYIDVSVLSPGDVLVMEEGEGTFVVGPRDRLTGVYNMNNGYADFTKINVLSSNKEYSIVRSGTMYGLNVYDHIVLDGKSVTDDDFVFEQKKDKGSGLPD